MDSHQDKKIYHNGLLINKSYKNKYEMCSQNVKVDLLPLYDYNIQLHVILWNAFYHNIKLYAVA